jgi:hypothetical protein
MPWELRRLDPRAYGRILWRQRRFPNVLVKRLSVRSGLTPAAKRRQRRGPLLPYAGGSGRGGDYFHRQTRNYVADSPSRMRPGGNSVATPHSSPVTYFGRIVDLSVPGRLTSPRVPIGTHGY